MKKIAILSDIHGNVWALKSVLKHIEQHPVDLIINLGDSLYGPLAPMETYKVLTRINMISIRGNEDSILISTDTDVLNNNPTLDYVRKNIDSQVLNWIKELPRTTTVDGKLFLCHGTPFSENDYLLENVKSRLPNVKEEIEIIKEIESVDQKIILCGHTHIPRIVRLRNGILILNPGSVGLQAYSDKIPVNHKMQNYHNYATYIILDMNKDDYEVEIHYVNYDTKYAIESALKNEREDWAIAINSGRAL